MLVKEPCASKMSYPNWLVPMGVLIKPTVRGPLLQPKGAVPKHISTVVNWSVVFSAKDSVNVFDCYHSHCWASTRRGLG
jgi:hypothetical protein